MNNIVIYLQLKLCYHKSKAMTNKNLENLFEEFSNSSHHAFLLESKDREKDYEYFKSEIEKENTNQNENLFLNLKVLDINKAREILEYGKTNFEKKHFIVVSFYSINREAQNALLKFLEETSQNIKIIFIIHSGAKILNTIYSRMYKLNSSSKEENINDEFDSLAKEFLKSKKLSRMKIKGIVELLAKKDEYALENEDKERSDR
jgi:DNA polymerase III delta prime subunit